MNLNVWNSEILDAFCLPGDHVTPCLVRFTPQIQTQDLAGKNSNSANQNQFNN